MFPMFVSLNRRGVMIAGAGAVALRKAGVLLRCGALLRVASPAVTEGFVTVSGAERIEFTGRPYSASDMTEPLGCGVEISMAIAATSDRNVNHLVWLDAVRLGLPVNVADSPEECSFFFPSFVEHDSFVAGISSSGRSPSVCRGLAERLRLRWGEWVRDALGGAGDLRGGG
jgi:siroheme synthase-like protein